MDIFEGLENLNVSEECFDDIIALIEGVMDEIKAGKDPEKVKQEFVKTKNKEYVEANKNANQANRVRRKALKKWFEGKINGDQYKKVEDQAKQVSNIEKTKFKNQLGLNYDIEAGKNKTILPNNTVERNADGSFKTAYQKGFEKGGKPYKPKNS